MPIDHSEQGQILIIFLGLMVVALGIGLTMSSRSTILQQQSNVAETSETAYYAAEAGLEAALVNPDLSSCTPVSPCTDTLGNNCIYEYYIEIDPNSVITLEKDRLLGLDTSGIIGSLQIQWNRSALANTLEVIKVSENLGVLATQKTAYACQHSGKSGYTPAGLGEGGFSCSTSSLPITLDGTVRRVTLKMLQIGGAGVGDIQFNVVGGTLKNDVQVIYSKGTCSSTSRLLKVTRVTQNSGQDFTLGIFAPLDDLDLQDTY